MHNNVVYGRLIAGPDFYLSYKLVFLKESVDDKVLIFDDSAFGDGEIHACVQDQIRLIDAPTLGERNGCGSLLGVAARSTRSGPCVKCLDFALRERAVI